MITSRLLRACAAAALLAVPHAGWAVFDPVNDDTDIFLANPSFNSERPNILIILDNTANWNTPFTAEKTALVNVVNSLSSNFNVGLMLFTETGSGNTGNDGGYIRFGIRQMDSTNKGRLASVVGGLDKLADKSNGGKGALAMYEAFQYFSAGLHMPAITR
jgi:type IV pilus assembly protein PilY1